MASSGNIKIFYNEDNSGSINVLNGVALNATAATRTLHLKDLNRMYSHVKVTVVATRAAYTALTFAPTVSDDGTHFASITTHSIASGADTISVLTQTYTTSSSAKIELCYNVEGKKEFKLLLGGTSAGGSDTVIVQAVAVGGV